MTVLDGFVLTILGDRKHLLWWTLGPAVSRHQLLREEVSAAENIAHPGSSLPGD